LLLWWKRTENKTIQNKKTMFGFGHKRQTAAAGSSSTSKDGSSPVLKMNSHRGWNVAELVVIQSGFEFTPEQKQRIEEFCNASTTPLFRFTLTLTLLLSLSSSSSSLLLLLFPLSLLDERSRILALKRKSSRYCNRTNRVSLFV